MAGNLTAMMASIFSGGVTADPYYEYTTLLLPGNGTNGAQNNTFLDGSTNNFTITRNGNTTQGTFSPFSQTGWGNYFDGTGDYLTGPTTNAAFDFGADPFTIEFWIYPTSFGATQTVVASLDNATAGALAFGVQITTSGAVQTYVWNGSSYFINVASNTGAVKLNAWNHVAVVRSGANFGCFVNGTREGSSTTISGTQAANRTLNVGRDPYGAGSLYVFGYLSNIRIVKGTAVYDPTQTTITVPTAPLTAISGTSLLTCQSNRFIDNSTNNFTITRNGDTRVVALSPFNPTASWSAATYGGSGYFDGSGDYLQGPTNAAFTMGTGDFTIELWYYPIVDYVSGNVYLYDLGSNGTRIQIFNNNVYFTPVAGSGITGTTGQGVLAGAWYHIACVRAGSTITMYLNGSSIGSVTNTSNLTDTACRIGAYGGGASNFFNGYMANFRIVKGTAVYTTAFTPPTAPLTAITNTSLLLNFTNAGIYDATSKNDLETVADAQISNTTAKWGSTSIKFDGTGDWLLIPDQPPQRIGTGNFTIEMWVYRNSSGTYGLAGKGTGTTGWLVSLNSSNQVVFTYGSSTITSSGTVSATTWTHIAVVREGTSTNQTKIYINGTNDGTGTVSTDFNQTNSMYIGADRTGGSAANAYVQDVRITNYARYTANFTAPTAAFPTL